MRKLLGYRLKEEFKEFYKAYSFIAFGNDCGSAIYETYNYESRDIVVDRLKQAGVMHWFEEVYEEDEKFKVGDIIVVEEMHSKSWLDKEDYNKILQIVGKRSAYASGMLYTVRTKLGKKGGLNGTFRHANQEEKAYFNGCSSFNGKTAIIDGIEYELKIKN